MKTTIACLSLLILLLPLHAGATTYSYPNTGKPLFSLDIPDRWHVEIEEATLHAGPPDKSVYLGFAPLDANLSGDDVGSAVEGIISSMVSNPHVNSSKDLVIDGMPFSYMEGSGTDEQGQPMNFGVAMFSPNGEIICVVFYLGSPENEARYESQLIKIIESIRRGGPATPPPPPPVQTVSVGNGWKVDIPTDATQVSSGPNARYVTHSPKMLIELEYMRTDSNCRDFLSEEHRHTQKSLESPVQQQLMQLVVIPTHVAGRSALITEGGVRTPEEALSDTPMHPLTMVMLCVTNHEAIITKLSMREGEITNRHRDVIRQIVESARK